MAMELSDAKWELDFSDGNKERVVRVGAGEQGELRKQISLAKEKFHLAGDCPVNSFYKAGQDGVRIHRMLEERGIGNLVLDLSGIEVNRRKRRNLTVELAWLWLRCSAREQIGRDKLLKTKFTL
uniref:Uncharacterized protein n=1 Tax=Candidatus Kentrum eta TaxID=2126337 RepID=A0A450UL27_9GAMM|nr:MAG: hypothetical protein BECKH772A_GA0070896_1004118 [Candidatus Kentron sp. H]VFJ93217.1 MAG: hypothetical protein BECKH772B_GA0070898_1004018 [Candidatus Kentron sp. H]VFK00087.1 MAG: hypothetical protein BECKH772C_GA0070978_1003918 [Candidatus Kentron sp. H]